MRGKGGTGEIDRVTTRREAKQATAQTSTRWGAIGYHSPVSTAPASGPRRDGRRLETEGRGGAGGVGKRKGDGEVRTYACVHVCIREEAGRKRCAGSESNARSRGAEPDRGREKSVMDAQLDADINIDTAEPTTR